jgi:3-deoxy-D-manno-octulosonic-acid transferase
MRHLYTLFLGLAALLLAPFLPLLLWVPRVRKGLGMRLGFLPRDVRERAFLSEGSLWVHAASLGEVNAVAPVLRELLPKLPRLGLVITCTTQAGREQAQRLFPQAFACLLMPLDLPFLLSPWIRRFKPRLAVIAETELWPNFLQTLHASGASILVANGRMTRRSAGRYRLVRGAMAELLEKVDLFAMQAEDDAQRLLSLGARPARVQVVGNTKFDLDADLEALGKAAAELRRSLGLDAKATVVVAGSTRPGEEALLLDAFRTLKKGRAGLKLVLAPRHLERIEDVIGTLKKGRWNFVRRSEGVKMGDAELLLLDTLGELRHCYALASGTGLAWIGGAFKDFGGQNPLEASALGVPALFGPHMRHFPEIAQALLDGGAALQVPADALAAQSGLLLDDEKRRRAMGAAGKACVAAHAGASRRAAEMGLRLLLLARMRRDGQAWREEGFDSFRKTVEFGSSLDDPDWRHEAPLAPPQGREFGQKLDEERDALG